MAQEKSYFGFFFENLAYKEGHMSLTIGKNVYQHIKPTAVGRVWKGFTGPDGFYLLHIPTAHLLKSDEELVSYVDNDSAHSAAALNQRLDAISSQLPQDFQRSQPEIDIMGISMNVIQSCNLRCTYCYAGDGDYGVDSKMSEETAFRTVDFFAKGKKTLHINFFGGEPLMNLKLIQSVVAYCKTKTDTKFYFSMTSNGTLLNEQTLKFLHQHKINLTISYDGKGLHAAQRLNLDKTTNSEALVEKKLKTYEKELQKIPGFGLRATIHKDNIPLVREALFRTLNEKQFEYTFVRNSEKGERGYSFEQVRELATIFSEVVDSLLGAERYDQILRIGNIRSNVNKIHTGQVGNSFCGAGTNYLSVSTTGAFYLCHRFTEDEDERLGDLDSGLNKPAIQRFAAHRGVTHDPCQQCWIRQWCGGGCYHEHKMANNTTFLPDPLFCFLMDNEMKLAMRVYLALQTHRPDLIASKRPLEPTSRYVE